MSIPIVIGVTGHRNLREEDIPLLKEVVISELQKLKHAYPDSDFIMLNSLAYGADSLCAEAGISLGMGLVCPLPLEIEEYRKDFSEEELSVFEGLIQKADDYFVAPVTEQLPESAQPRDFAYRQAGIYVASHSHVLLALWDGEAGKENGCGTAEAVEFMLRGNYKDDSISLKSANDGAVIHVMAPRQGSDYANGIFVSLIENEPGSLKEVLSATDDFNRKCKELPDSVTGNFSLIQEQDVKEDQCLRSIQKIYNEADALSLRFQKRYLRAVKGFSLFGVLLVLSFLLYDEANMNIFLPVYGLVMILYLVLFLVFKKKNAHMQYLQYRVLAESMRVQFYLCAAGINKNIGNAFTWTQKHESAWVKEATGAVIIGCSNTSKVSDEILKKYWMGSQLEYHQKAFRRDRGKQGINKKTAFGMLVASISLFLLVFALEFFTQGVMEHILIAGIGLNLRALLKILLGSISAVTLFLSSYFDKLSFERMSFDHDKMIRLYQTALEYFDRSNREHLFWELAREEIIENGNWMSYCRENAPTFNL